MKIVSPTKAAQILEELIEKGKATEVTFCFRPDYRLDTEGVQKFLQIINVQKPDLDIGGYMIDQEGKPFITINLVKVDWDGEVVKYNFPDMGQAISDSDFRSSSNVAYTVEVEENETVDLKRFFTPPTLSEYVNIAWGDTEQIESKDVTSDLTHTYTIAGTYTIFIKGNLIKTTRSCSTVEEYEQKKQDTSALRVIHFIKPLVLQSTWQAFSTMPNLHTIIGTVICRGRARANMNILFKGSHKLENIKGLKFVLNINHDSTERHWKSDEFLGGGVKGESNPSFRTKLLKDFRAINFDKEDVTSLDNFCPMCDIEVLPNWLFGKNVVNAYRAFEDCPNITYIPGNQFEKLETAYEMFQCRPNVSADDTGSLEGAKLTVSSNIKFSNLKKGFGMFSNRLLSFEDIKAIFESLPENPHPPSIGSGVNRVDGIDSNEMNGSNSGADYCITFSFDKNEPGIKEKLIEYFNLNTAAIQQWHEESGYGKQMSYESNETVLDKDWDGGWYPINFTYYGSSWDCNNHKSWWVNFRNPNNYIGYDGPNAVGGISL